MQNTIMVSKLKSVISLVDNLRDINLQQYIKLPKIVTVGGQSSGKSSLIEQIVGKDFLPRGSGVVTRRPLQIRMVCRPDIKQTYSQFEQTPNKKFISFDQVKKNIENLTDIVCGKNKNILDKPIILTIYSPNSPNLTIIDLPGLTRISIESQDANILEVTTKMITKYMQQPTTIILCVIPANQDITNDQVLAIARKIDPNGERTIGCLTKIDIMDRGTNARELLLNKGQVKLKLGFVGIKNRCQADIQENKTVKYSLQQEKAFFSKSPIYSSLPPSCLGTTALVDMLSKLLAHSIIKFLPDLLEKVKQRKRILHEIVKSYGKPLPKTIEEKQTLVWQISSQYVRQLKKAISGQRTSIKNNAELQKISFIMKQSINQILQSQMESKLQESLSDSYILFALRKFQGASLAGFPTINTFMYLLDPLLQKLRSPLLSALHSIYDSLHVISQFIISDIAHQFISFREYIKLKNSQVFSIYKKQSEQFIQNVMQAQIGYIYTNHPFYLQMMNDESPKKQNITKQALNNPLIVVLRKRVSAYYKVVVQNLRDIIPKNIQYKLFKVAIEKLEYQIFQDSGFGSNKLQEWFKVGDSDTKQRIAKERQYATVLKAQQYLLSHGGFSELRKEEMERKKAQRQKQMNQNSKKQPKVQLSPIKQQSIPNQKLNQSLDKNKFPVQKLNPQSAKNFTNLFGVTPDLAEVSIKNENTIKETNKTNTITNSNSKRIFNDQIKPKNKNDLTNIYNQQVGKITDNAVEEMYKNQQFKQKSKQTVQNASSLAAQKQLGVSQEQGKIVGKGIGWIFGQNATQNFLKEETKKAARNQTQI